jgi:hypothetical protein
VSEQRLEPTDITLLGGRKELSCQLVALLARRQRGRRCSTWRLARVASWRNVVLALADDSKLQVSVTTLT